MNTEMAVVMLDQMEPADPEKAHVAADEILLDWIRANGGQDVAAAYDAVVERASWWGAG